MGALRQDAALRAGLKATWDAQPAVKQLRQDTKAFAVAHNLAFDAAGLSAALAFGSAWIDIHGALPDSGIWVG